ncbi:MAG: carbohydrate-binding family 9-like protein [Planctomycetota bacterium]|jgi:hypothetical protein
MIASIRLIGGLLFISLSLSSCGQAGEPGGAVATAVKIHRAAGPVTVDGKLNEKAWQDALVIPLAWEKAWKRDANKKRFAVLEPVAKPISWAKVIWDEKAIYFACWCEDKDILATKVGRDEELWREDAMEIFFRPDRTVTNYWEYEWSPKNQLLDIRWPAQARDFKRDKKWNGKSESAVRVDGTISKHNDTDKGWTLEVRIPFTDFAPLMERAPRVGDVWGGTILHYSKWMDGRKKRQRSLMPWPIMLTNEVDKYAAFIFVE